MIVWLILLGGALATAACGGGNGDGESSPTATERSTERLSPTTQPPETTDQPTTTRRTTTTVRTTTTTPPDPLTQAVTAAGFGEPTPELRQAVDTLCEGFTARDAEAINATVSSEATQQEYLRIAFAVVCPGNEALVGIAVMPSGDPAFPYFPRIVDVGTIDSRVASWFEGKLVDGQVVALAPGVYAPYNPNVPDLVSYMTLPNDGDCAMRERYFPDSGGACWNGVQPGHSEQ